MRGDGEGHRQRISLRLAVKEMNSDYSDIKVGYRIGIGNKGFSYFFRKNTYFVDISWLRRVAHVNSHRIFRLCAPTNDIEL
jgi:hypothetical protein